MSFDTSTLYLFATMVAGMLGAMLLLFGKQENIPALKWWGTAYLLGASSVAIWTIGGATLGEPLLLALHALGFVACGMVWNASRVFHGRKPNLPGLLFGAIVWIGMALAVPSLNPATAADRRCGDRRDLCGADGFRIVERTAADDAEALADDCRARDAWLRAGAADPARQPAAPA